MTAPRENNLLTPKEIANATVGELLKFLATGKGRGAAEKYFFDPKEIARAIKSIAQHLPRKADWVTVTCYGDSQRMRRQDAIEFYEEAQANSDGCERERYLNVLEDLRNGLKTCSDKR